MSSKNNCDLPVIIAGGGIGGVTTALALGQKGFAVQLLEQADQIGAIGYGVQLGPNVMPMFESLGISESVRRASYFPSDISLYELNSGDLLANIPLRTPEFIDRYHGNPYLAIHRADLHEILITECAKHQNISLNNSTTVIGVEQTEECVKVNTLDGKTIEGVALIAADGLRSKMRSQLHPNDVSRETGYVAHRALVPFSKAPQSMQRRSGVTMWTGAGFHVIYYPLRNASEMNVVVVVQVPVGVDSTDNASYREHIGHLMSMAQREAQDAVNSVNLDRRWSIADRNPIRKWGEGRVTLLGDSAHATLQSFAQGAGMAIEDAVVLASTVEESRGDFTLAFRDFQSVRFLRTARVVLGSRALWNDFHCNGVDAEVRTEQFKERGVEEFYKCLDWLWTPIKLAN